MDKRNASRQLGRGLLASSLAMVLSACAGAPQNEGGSAGGPASGSSAGSSPASSAGTGGSGGAVVISSSTGGGGATASSGGSGQGGAVGSAGQDGGSQGGTIGAAGMTSSSGGSATTGGSAANGGTPSFEKAAGTIQNKTQPASTTNLQKGQWAQGLISPTLLEGTHLNQPVVFNGYLMMAGNEDFFFYDVSDATAPKQLSKMTTPNRRVGGEAESHTVSFARAGSTFYMVTTGGTGIDTWDVTSATAPKHLAQLKFSGVNYGDYTEAVWGVSWQGQYIYVGATNNGIKVVDASDPANLKIAAEVSTSSYGGVSAGPVDVIGNVLVVMTPKESSGIATLDVSDPTKPTRLASLTTGTKSYITQFHRHYAVMLGPIRVWDVLTNPTNIGSGSSPIATMNNEYAEYSAFSDDYLFIGHARQEIGNLPGASKITFSDPKSMKVVNRIYGRLDTTYNDDQFPLPMGNLLVMTDDQSPYRGWAIGVHQTAPDTTAPLVDTVIPGNSAAGVSTKSRIGVTFSDNIELATVNQASFIVRPMGGQALSGRYGVRMGVVNFDPDQDLQPATTYEVVLPKGGIADYVGNTLASEWRSTFTTN